MDLGSEWGWDRSMFPHRGNGLLPAKLIYGMDHVNYLFYKDSPGVPMPNPTDLRQTPDKNANPPEFAWWEFNIDDVTAGAGAFMMAITDVTDPNRSRFLNRRNGKLLLYHGPFAAPAILASCHTCRFAQSVRSSRDYAGRCLSRLLLTTRRLPSPKRGAWIKDVWL